MTYETGISYRDTARALTGFIEVAIHTILRTRQVYPADLFVKRRKYDAPVFQSRHPALNEYIAGAVRAVEDELLIGVLDKVIVVIKDETDQALERFIFALNCVVAVEIDELEKPIPNSMTEESLNLYFRAFMIKLSAMESQLGEFASADNLTFAIVVECRPGLIPSATQDQSEPLAWTPASKSHVSSGVSEKAQLHAVKAVETGVINMTLAVQESEFKLMRLQTPARSSAAAPVTAPAGEGEKRIKWEDKGKGRAS